jgi:hypothetical protein
MVEDKEQRITTARLIGRYAEWMTYSDIIAAIDLELGKLHEVRTLLSGTTDVLASISKRGRPKGSLTKATSPVEATAPVKGKRTLSAESRAKIAEAQRKRHAAKKRAAKKAAQIA